jgi:hypothetical protein
MPFKNLQEHFSSVPACYNQTTEVKCQNACLETCQKTESYPGECRNLQNYKTCKKFCATTCEVSDDPSQNQFSMTQLKEIWKQHMIVPKENF